MHQAQASPQLGHYSIETQEVQGKCRVLFKDTGPQDWFTQVKWGIEEGIQDEIHSGILDN